VSCALCLVWRSKSGGPGRDSVVPMPCGALLPVDGAAAGPADEDQEAGDAPELGGPGTCGQTQIDIADTGRYSFEKVIGKGASAKVWKAMDTKVNRPVAIKEFQLFSGSEDQFRREVGILQALNAADEQGKYVVRLLDTFTNLNGKACIVMDVS